jgi:hypothetical protein
MTGRFLIGRIIFLGILILTPALLLAGCGGGPPSRAEFPELTYAHLGPLKFDAGRLEIVNEYHPPMQSPNVEHAMPVRPALAATRWAKDRLQVTGRNQNRVLRFAVKNAKVVETNLAREPGLQGAFTHHQSERYDAETEVLLELLTEKGVRDSFASAAAHRSITVVENATLNEREQAQYDLVEQLMRDLNAELEKNIRQYMGDRLL